jgi:hypothetical protein
MPLIAYKLILISLDLQRLREIVNLLEGEGHTDEAAFITRLIQLTEEI